MVCKNCGNFVADGHSFCSNCGAKIQIAPAPGSNRKKSGSAAVWIIVAAAAAGLVAGRFIWKTTPSEIPSQTAVSSSASQSEQYIPFRDTPELRRGYAQIPDAVCISGDWKHDNRLGKKGHENARRAHVQNERGCNYGHLRDNKHREYGR